MEDAATKSWGIFVIYVRGGLCLSILRSTLSLSRIDRARQSDILACVTIVAVATSKCSMLPILLSSSSFFQESPPDSTLRSFIRHRRNCRVIVANAACLSDYVLLHRSK